MKRFLTLPILAAVIIFVTGCDKNATEAERKAEIERQVQERLAAEHQAQEQQRLSQGQVDLNQRVQDLENQSATPAASDEPESAEATTAARSPRYRDDEEDPASADYETFYNRLEPEGDWMETSNYGYVWQPRVAVESRGWRPYTNGRWVYTDAGWTWISEEPFGWATYHYGRWTRLRNVGWVWVPGNEWAPAWVSWRKSDEYVGWAPLPPEARFERGSGIHQWADSYYDIGPEQYSFVPTVSLGEQRIERVVVPAEQNVTIVNRTTNVTNITYQNTVIINNGPNYDEVRARSRQPIERLRLERQTSVNVASGDSHPMVRGDVVQMTAPVIPRAQRVERPKQVKRTIAQAEVERGWENIGDRQAAEQARAKMRSEATPPPNAPRKRFVRQNGGARSDATAVAPPTSVPPGARREVTSAAVGGGTPMPVKPQPRPPLTRNGSTITPTPSSSTTPASTATPANTATPVIRATPASTATSASTATPVSTATPGATTSPMATIAPEQTPPLLRPMLSPGRKPSSIPHTDSNAPAGATTPLQQQTPVRRGFVPVPAAKPSASPTATGTSDEAATATPIDLRGGNRRGLRREAPQRDRRGQAQSADTTATPTPVTSPADASATQPNDRSERNLGVAPHGPPSRQRPHAGRGPQGSPEASPTPTPTP